MNPAARLLAIYDALAQQGPDQPLMQMWAKVFGLDVSSPHLEDDVTACVVALRQQIDFARMRLSAHSVPPELTNPGFNNLKNVASPGHLHASWKNHRDSILRPDARQAFTWAAWVLRDEAEDDMPPEELSTLRAELESLEDRLRQTEMSQYLRDFVQRQVDTIRAALRVYGVQGVRPVQDALRKVVGDYAVEKARVDAEYAVAPNEAKGIFAKASETIKKTAEVCDNLDKIKKAGGQVFSLATAVGPLVLPYIDIFLK